MVLDWFKIDQSGTGINIPVPDCIIGTFIPAVKYYFKYFYYMVYICFIL